MTVPRSTSPIIRAFWKSDEYQWYLTEHGRARHIAPIGANNPSLCGIDPERLVRVAPSPIYDDRYHLGCTLCYGIAAKTAERTSVKQAQGVK